MWKAHRLKFVADSYCQDRRICCQHVFSPKSQIYKSSYKKDHSFKFQTLKEMSKRRFFGSFLVLLFQLGNGN